MKVGRLPSAGITQPLRYLCAPPTSRPPGSDFGYPYTEPLRPSPATNEISRVTHHNFPHMPSRRPRRAHLLLSRLFHRWHRPSPSDHRVGTLNQQVTRLYGFPSSTACEFAILSFWKVFSIHLALRVTPQNRIFASGVNRKFPAPDFNRQVALLPRHTVRSMIEA